MRAFMLIVAVRHIATAWNTTGLLQGKQNMTTLPHSPSDIELAHSNRNLINQYGLFDQVWTSQLCRTQETARCYGYPNFQICSLVDELDFGKYEGQPKTRLEQECAPLWQQNPLALTLGEPLSKFQERIFQFLDYNNSGYQRILIFGHGSWLRALHSIVNQNDINNMNQIENLANNHYWILNYESVKK